MVVDKEVVRPVSVFESAHVRDREFEIMYECQGCGNNGCDVARTVDEKG